MFDLESSFTHAILRPYFRLWQRVGQPIAVRPAFNDLAIEACEVSITCAHWPERVSATQARYVKAISTFDKLCDTSDSTKHFRLRNADRDVTVTTELVFEWKATGIRFLRNNVTAESTRWGSFDLLATLKEFVDELIQQTGFNGGVAPVIILPEWPEKDAVEVRLARQSLPVEKTKFRLVTIDTDGSWQPVDGREIAMRLVPDPELEPYAKAIEAGLTPPPLPSTGW